MVGSLRPDGRRITHGMVVGRWRADMELDWTALEQQIWLLGWFNCVLEIS